jgi:predicted dehydrogenase
MGKYVALCDVTEAMAKAFRRWPAAVRYTVFVKCSKRENIDAVLIAAPLKFMPFCVYGMRL